MADARKRRDLSLKEKIVILEQYDKLPKMSQRNAAAQLKISQPILCKLLRKRFDLEDAAIRSDNVNSKRNRSGKDEQVEAALKQWFANVREHDARIDGPMMRRKAEELAKKMGKDHFVATEGWFRRWKKRENIEYTRTDDSGERKDADLKSAETWIENEWSKITLEFSSDNIFHAEETVLHYRALPDHTDMFKQDNTKGNQTLTDRLTIQCCTNMSGAKEQLLVIGNRKNPQCFKTVKRLPVHYYSNTNTRMTSMIFNDWLLKWDNRLDRKIALLVDKREVHSVNCLLTNIKVFYVPANTTSMIQGTVREMKAYYRKEMQARVLESMENAPNDLVVKMNLLDALHLITMSWDQVTKTEFTKWFQHDVEDEHLNVQPADMAVSEFEGWQAIDNQRNVTENVTEDICQSETAEDQEELEPPTNREIRKALAVLRQAVQQRSSDFQTHYAYEIFVNNLIGSDQQ